MQKFTVIAAVLLVVCVLFAVIIRSSGPGFMPLYPSSHLQSNDLAEIRHYLQQLSIPFKEDGDKGFLVPEEQVDRLRLELAAAGIPKYDQGKGFELFDTNTWIKGEKELQVLEMRALKGQIEKDLAGFDQIKSASVILDMAPPRSIGSAHYKTKASVILTLMPKAFLSQSQLKAITYHLAGAVRGLEPNMIAISDTTGRLYQAIDPEGQNGGVSNLQVIFEEHLKEKIDRLLTKMVGEENFFASIEATFDRNSHELASLSVSILIDKEILNGMEDKEAFAKDLNRQLASLLKGYHVHDEPVIDFFPFKKKRHFLLEREQKKGWMGFSIALGVMLLTIAMLVWFFFLKKGVKKEASQSKDPLLEIMTQVDHGKLARSIQDEDPEVIAEMLSYLEPARAEQLIAALPEKVQQQVLYYLTELEKEEV